MNSKIKKIIFLIILIIPYTGYTSKIKLGLHGGINFSTITASNATKEFNMGKGFLPGILLGIVSEYSLDNDIHLVTEINYSSKGYLNNQSGIRVKSYSKYFTIPIKVRVYTENKLGLEIGPYFGFAFREYSKNNLIKTNVYGSIGNNIFNEPPDTLKPFDLGIQSGLSYALNNINISGLISFGILNIRPGGGLGNSIRNLSTQIRLTYNLLNLDWMRKVKRDSYNGILGGVCEGLGEYFSIDPVIIRLMFIATSLMLGGGILTYIVAWIIIPDRY